MRDGKAEGTAGGVFGTFHGDDWDMGIFLDPHHGIEVRIIVVVFDVDPIMNAKFQ